MKTIIAIMLISSTVFAQDLPKVYLLHESIEYRSLPDSCIIILHPDFKDEYVFKDGCIDYLGKIIYVDYSQASEHYIYLMNVWGNECSGFKFGGFILHDYRGHVEEYMTAAVLRYGKRPLGFVAIDNEIKPVFQ